jgi:hypothetical protein
VFSGMLKCGRAGLISQAGQAMPSTFRCLRTELPCKRTDRFQITGAWMHQRSKIPGVTSMEALTAATVISLEL